LYYVKFYNKYIFIQ